MLSMTKSLKKSVDQKAMQSGQGALGKTNLHIQNLVVDGLKGLKYAQECGDMPVNTTMHSVPYDQRILDTFARLCHIDSKLACAAVMLQGQELVVSYNLTSSSKDEPSYRTEVNDKIIALKNMVFDATITSDDLINHLLKSKHAFYFPKEYKEIFDKDKWGEEIKNCNTINDQTKNIIEGFFELALSSPADKEELIESINNINNAYEYIIQQVPQNDCADVLELLSSAQSRMLYFRERLMQDCTKIKDHLDNSCLNGVNITIIDNPNNRHAEVHLLEKAKDSYIGISKLSCYLCQSIISHYETQNSSVLHFGGSGIVYTVKKDQVPDMMCQDVELWSASMKKIVISTKTTYVDGLTGTSCDPAGQYAKLSPTAEDLLTPWLPVQIIGDDATADL